MPDAHKLFEALVREHAEMLLVYLRAALGNTSDVDDLFQETMIVAWRRLDDFDQSRPFGQWLRGIAKRLVLAHHRRRGSRPCDPVVLDQLDVRIGDLAAHPSDTWQEKLALLPTCIQLLPDHFRHAVRLRYFQQQAIGQLAESLEASEATVKKRLQRARALILDCIQKNLSRLGLSV
jgi:RNA polymerase sigma-70 factor (ECF subfamily)